MQQYSKNPRKITDAQLDQLKSNIQELGDLSGIVHDLNTDEIISGNQRSKVININECEIEIVKKYDEPNEQGTIAFGFVIFENQRLNYRQVRWNEKQREKACITANALGGEFDYDILLENWDIAELENWGIKDLENKIVLIALQDKTPVGCVRVEILEDNTAYLSRFGVRTTNQNNGIGKSIMNLVDKIMIEKGVKEISLHTGAKITSLVRFYYGRGFYIDSTDKSRGYVRALLKKEY